MIGIMVSTRVVLKTCSRLTIHVIGLGAKGLSPTGEGRILEARCFADYNGGLYLTPETTDDLIAALERTLGCPAVSRRTLDRVH